MLQRLRSPFCRAQRSDSLIFGPPPPARPVPRSPVRPRPAALPWSARRGTAPPLTGNSRKVPCPVRLPNLSQASHRSSRVLLTGTLAARCVLPARQYAQAATRLYCPLVFLACLLFFVPPLSRSQTLSQAGQDTGTSRRRLCRDI